MVERSQSGGQACSFCYLIIFSYVDNLPKAAILLSFPLSTFKSAHHSQAPLRGPLPYTAPKKSLPLIATLSNGFLHLCTFLKRKDLHPTHLNITPETLKLCPVSMPTIFWVGAGTRPWPRLSVTFVGHPEDASLSAGVSVIFLLL